MPQSWMRCCKACFIPSEHHNIHLHRPNTYIAGVAFAMLLVCMTLAADHIIDDWFTRTGMKPRRHVRTKAAHVPLHAKGSAQGGDWTGVTVQY